MSVTQNEQRAPLPKILIRGVVSALAACLVIIGICIKVKTFANTHWYLAVTSISFYVLMLFLFIFRCSTKEASTRPMHWLFALSGTLLPVAAMPTAQHPWWLTWLSVPVVLAGTGLSIIAIYTLGRSFGIIAAKREIKTGGVYQIIRHPLYAGEALWFLALVLQNLSVFNVALFIVQSTCQIRRILEEEALLQKDESYARYMQNVPWRLIPGLF